MIAIFPFTRNRYGWSEFSERFVFSTSHTGKFPYRDRVNESKYSTSLNQLPCSSGKLCLRLQKKSSTHDSVIIIFPHQYDKTRVGGCTKVWKFNFPFHLVEKFLSALSISKFFNYFQSITSSKTVIKKGILLNFAVHVQTWTLPFNPQVRAASKIKLWRKSSRKNVLILAIMKIAWWFSLVFSSFCTFELPTSFSFFIN